MDIEKNLLINKIECWILVNKTIVVDKSWMYVEWWCVRKRRWHGVLKDKLEDVETIVHSLIENKNWMGIELWCGINRRWCGVK